MSRQRVLNLTPKSTEQQLSCPCHVVMLGEREALVRSSPQNQKGELWGPGMLSWGQGTAHPTLHRDALCERDQIRWVFKESIKFCLSFQVDLTTTSAAAALGAGAAAKFLIYRSQNTYKRDFYCYTVVQRGKMQLWEGRWLMESSHPRPVPPQHSTCTPLLSGDAHQLFCTFNNSKSSKSYSFQTYSDHRHKKTQHHQNFIVCFSPQKRI